MEDMEANGPVYVAPIKQESVIPILRAESSEWLWIMLPNGDRMVGFFPHEEGAEYLHAEDSHELDENLKKVNGVELYGCDACDRLVTEDEITHSLGIDNGQGDTSQCDECMKEAFVQGMRMRGH